MKHIYYVNGQLIPDIDDVNKHLADNNLKLVSGYISSKTENTRVHCINAVPKPAQQEAMEKFLKLN